MKRLAVGNNVQLQLTKTKMRALWGFLALFYWGSMAQAAEVIPESSQIRTDFFGNLTLSLAMDEAVPARVRYLKNPMRIVIAFEGLDMSSLPSDFGEGLRGVDRFQFGAVQDGGRMVLSYHKPHRVEKMQIIPKDGDEGARIEIEINKTSEAVFNQLTRELAYQGEDLGYRIKPPAKGPEQAPLVLLDPGHGGVDPGAERDGILEKDITLHAANHIADYLLRTGRYRVAMTRDHDIFMSLQSRRRLGSQLKADIFLSIHADTVEVGDARGTTIYQLSDRASSEAAAHFARFENRVDVFAGETALDQETDLGLTLVELAQRSSQERADKIARLLQSEWIEINQEARESRMESAGFVVLKAPEISSLLLEIGYLSNDQNRINMQNSAYLDALSQGLLDALDGYFYP